MARDFTRPFRAIDDELAYPGELRRGARGMGAKRVQEHLTLQGFKTGVDGDFGGGTEGQLKAFQRARGLGPTGVLDEATWSALTAPLRSVRVIVEPAGRTLNQLSAFYAERLADARPREAGPVQNDGAWVRTLMLGNDGDPWEWCAGTVMFVLAQACASRNVKLTDRVSPTFGCPQQGKDAERRGRLIRGADARDKVQPGDVVLFPRNGSWFHTGILTGVNGPDALTVEGNTNAAGSPAGVALERKRRAFAKLDYVRIG